MLLDPIFKPKKNYLLKRCGAKSDGGYLVGVNSLKKSNSFFSFGIGLLYSFETDFVKYTKHKVKTLFVDSEYDEKKLFLRFLKSLFANIFFKFNYKNIFICYEEYKNFKKFTSSYNFKKLFIKKNSIIEILSSTNFTKPFFFKIDIEGGEYELLDDLLKIKKSIQGLVIEFHNLHLKKNMTKAINFTKKINLDIVHIHPMNFENLLIKKKYSKNMEITFERNPKFKEGKNKLPHCLDALCDPNAPEIFTYFKN